MKVQRFKVVILDESHYIKNGKAKRTKICVPMLKVQLPEGYAYRCELSAHLISGRETGDTVVGHTGSVTPE